jgi:hypothetical protein
MMHSLTKSAVPTAILVTSLLCGSVWGAAPAGEELKKPVVIHSDTAAKETPDELGDSTREQATSIMRQIIRGVSEGDYAMFNRHFSKVMKASQPREHFLLLQKGIQKSLGKFKSLDYLGYYVQGGNRITLFKARFSKEKDDVLVRLVLDGKGSEPKVNGLWFDAPSLEK